MSDHSTRSGPRRTTKHGDVNPSLAREAGGQRDIEEYRCRDVTEHIPVTKERRVGEAAAEYGLEIGIDRSDSLKWTLKIVRTQTFVAKAVKFTILGRKHTSRE